MPQTRAADVIAERILCELVEAAADDGIVFEDDQLALIEQALSDAAQEAINAT